MRYTDKKRIQSWLNANRLQLPLRSSNLDSKDIAEPAGGIVNDSGLSPTDNISKDSIFKTDIKSQEKFSEREYSYETLTSKPDMEITTVNDTATYKATSTIRKNIS